MLSLVNVNVSYGAIKALHGVNLEVHNGEIVSLIGANGAGKSTTLKTICGLLRPSNKEAKVIFKDNWLFGIREGARKEESIKAHKIVEMGLSHVPEGRHIFPNMSVYENLLMGAYVHKGKLAQADFDRVYHHFPRLAERRKQMAGTLSGGEQQMLAIGRALMARPSLMLLDEPSMGLAPLLVEEIFHIIEDINSAGTTILLVEQNAHLALEISHRAYVLETGNIVLEGRASDLANQPAVRKAYLGEQ
ncbi:MAG: ABC transporter ATP-binding protein [Desulfitobacteriaceae bacterium]